MEFGTTFDRSWIKMHISSLKGAKCLFTLSVLVAIAFLVSVYTKNVNLTEDDGFMSSVKHIPDRMRFAVNQINGKYYGTRDGTGGEVKGYHDQDDKHGNSLEGIPDQCYINEPKTLTELMADQDVSPVFYTLANVTLHRRSLPNYYIYGSKSAQRKDYAECNIAFVHLHKAGGSTTKKKLRQVCRKTGMLNISMSHRHTTDVFDRFLKEDDTSEPIVFWGGFSFGICDILHRRPCSYMAVLRDPYDRIISAYFFCQNGRRAPLCGPVNARDVSITAWAIHQGSHFFNQLLVHADTCRNNSRYDGYKDLYQYHNKDIIKYADINEHVCWFRQKALHKEVLTPEQRRALLKYILDNLEHWFAVIGLLEDYELSLQLFEEAYRLPFTAVKTVLINTGKTRERTKDTNIARMKMELRNSAAVREALFEDIMIYEKGKQIMQLQKEEFALLKSLKGKLQ